MAFITFSNFKNGLDTRRSELTTQPGALLQLQDAHVNEGAEIEKRRAFQVGSYIPENALGIEVTGQGFTPGYFGGLVCFGSGSLITTTINRQNVAGVVTLNISAAKPLYSWVAGDIINVIGLGVNANSGLDSYNGNFVLTSATYHTGTPNYYSLVYSVTDHVSETVVGDTSGIVGWGTTQFNYGPGNNPQNSFGSCTTVSRAKAGGIATVVVVSYPPIYGVVNGNSIVMTGMGGTGYNGQVVVLSITKVSNGYAITYATTAGTEVTTADTNGTAYWPGGFTNFVYYQPLVHPAVQDGATFDATYHALTAITASTSFGGFTWVSATFSDGNTFAYWGQEYVPAFRNGQVLNGWATNQDIAKQLAGQITDGALSGFTVGSVVSAGATGYEFQIYSTPRQSFSLVSTPAANVGSGTMVSSYLSNSVETISAVAAAGSIVLTGGSMAGNASMSSIKVSTDSGATWGTNLLQAAVPFDTNLTQTATNIALSINTNTALNGAYNAVATGNTITVYANSNIGTTANGYDLQTVATGDLCVDNIVFNFTAAWASGDTVTGLLYNTTDVITVSILEATIIYDISDTLLSFVQKIATQIKTNVGYTAYAYVNTVVAGTVNLVISRLTASSATVAGTAGCTIAYTCYSGGLVYNGLSGGATNTVNPITFNILPAYISNATPGVYMFAVNNLLGGVVGTYTYNWVFTYKLGMLCLGGPPGNITSGATTSVATLALTFTPSDSYSFNGKLSCTITDAVGNTATQAASVVLY